MPHSHGRFGAGEKRAGRCNSEFLGVKPRTEERRHISAREYIFHDCAAVGPGKLDLLHEGIYAARIKGTLCEAVPIAVVILIVRRIYQASAGPL